MDLPSIGAQAPKTSAADGFDLGGRPGKLGEDAPPDREIPEQLQPARKT